MAPGKTPTAVLERWNRELVKVLSAPDVKVELDKLGMSPAPCSREDLAKFIASEFKTWGELVRERKIKSD